MTLSEILADGVVDENEMNALFAKYDTDKSGTLEADELMALAKDVAEIVPGATPEDILRVIDFYQIDYDDKIDADELRSFLEVHVAD